MTDCTNGLMRDQLPEYVHGTLSADAAARVDGHLAGCAPCREEVALLRSVRAMSALRTPVVDVATIIAALPAPPAAVRLVAPGSHRMTSRAWQYAAAAVVVLAVGTTSVWQSNRLGTPERIADSSTVRSGTAAHPAPSTSAGSAQSDAPDGISFGGGLSDLSVSDLQTLLVQVDSVKTMPSADPDSMTPVIAVKEGGKSL